jgi:hypothetical protein
MKAKHVAQKIIAVIALIGLITLHGMLIYYAVIPFVQGIAIHNPWLFIPLTYFLWMSWKTGILHKFAGTEKKEG